MHTICIRCFDLFEKSTMKKKSKNEFTGKQNTMTNLLT